MSIVYVQTAYAWGDETDALGRRAAFRAAARAHAAACGVDVPVIVVFDAASVADEAASWLALGGTADVIALADMDWQQAGEVVVSCIGGHRSDLAHLDRALRAAGLRRAGRAWGEAGQTRRYVRPSSASETLRAVADEARVRAGVAVVGVRDGWLSPDRRAAWRLRAEVAGSRALSSADVLDDRYGEPLPPPPIVDVRELLPARSGVDAPAWSLSLADEPEPMDVARACFAAHGVWPISFSYPGESLPVLAEPTDLIAPIVPGYPYSFDDPDDYLRTYQRAYLGVTHRKAGWDCFRHVEILAAGAVPLMPDAAQVPGFSMVHYPTRALARAADLVRSAGGPPDAATRNAFRAHVERHLTSAAMARYLLQASGLGDAARVLFVDERLPSHADYQSVLTLIGLKQVLGADCHVMFGTDYIYADTHADTAALYGRGFGYSRVVDPAARSATELTQPADLDLAGFDAVVVGSIARNDGLARDLLRRFPASRTIWVHGEDTPPLPDVVHGYRASGANVFVRAIHTGR